MEEIFKVLFYFYFYNFSLLYNIFSKCIGTCVMKEALDSAALMKAVNLQKLY